MLPHKEFKKWKKTLRIKSWSENVLHGQFVRQTKEVGGYEKWLCLKDADLKRETELLIMAAQV